jgi:glycosyl transferase family 25
MRTLVINLARSKDRRQVIQARLEELGVSFDFYPAVDGKSLTAQQKSLYSSRAAFGQIGREMHPNEIGCILSHIGIWQLLAGSSDDHAVVIEDDMLIDEDFPDLVRSFEWIPKDAAVVNFSWDMANPVELSPISAKRYTCRFDTEVMRTGSYFIRRSGAENLLRHAFPIRMPVDSLMGNERNAGPIYGVTPRPVNWNADLPSATWTDSTMADFSVDTRRSWKGLTLRMLNRLRRG